MEEEIWGLSRRKLLTSVGSLMFLSGCMGSRNEDMGETDVPSPIDLSGGKTDDQGGMVIGEHFGPNGQIFYRDNSPEGHDNPAWFHTLIHGLFPYYFEHKELGWEEIAIYVTDYSKINYTVETVREKKYISTHTQPETFNHAREVKYIAESNVLGGMGKELIPFSKQNDIEEFTNKYGGEILSFDDITFEWINNYIKKD